MKPLIQKLPLSEQTSFVARTYTTPLFETTWHQHEEIELIVQLKGKGLCFIGNHIGNFEAGDVFLLGSNLPHEFKKEKAEMECSVMVVHFKKNFWGEAFWNLPEAEEINRLLHLSTKAIKISGPANKPLAASIQQLEHATGFERIALLCQSLLLISRERRKRTLSSLQPKDLETFADNRLNEVVKHTIQHFDEPLSLAAVAALIPMSVSAFCRYFKRATKKTYVEFVNEIRISHACQLLMQSGKTMVEIAYDSGFNTIANFNKQFLKIKGMKPSEYRRKFSI